MKKVFALYASAFMAYNDSQKGIFKKYIVILDSIIKQEFITG